MQKASSAWLALCIKLIQQRDFSSEADTLIRESHGKQTNFFFFLCVHLYMNQCV